MFTSKIGPCEQNRTLREDIVQLNQWREVARRFEEENARLRALHNVTLAPKYDYITAQVVAGARGGVVSVGDNAARLLLLTDLASRVPVVVEGAGKKSTDEDEKDEVVRAILVGDNSATPVLSFPTKVEGIKPGQLILTSNDGGIFPKGLPIGEVEREGDLFRVRLAANFDRLDDRTDRAIDADAVLIVAPDGNSGLESGNGTDE